MIKVANLKPVFWKGIISVLIKKWIRIQVISLRLLNFFSTKNYFQIFCLFVSLIFILKLFRNEEMFIISLFSQVQIRVLGVKKSFFLQFLVDILPLDPDP